MLILKQFCVHSFAQCFCKAYTLPPTNMVTDRDPAPSKEIISESVRRRGGAWDTEGSIALALASASSVHCLHAVALRLGLACGFRSCAASTLLNKFLKTVLRASFFGPLPRVFARRATAIGRRGGAGALGRALPGLARGACLLRASFRTCCALLPLCCLPHAVFARRGSCAYGLENLWTDECTWWK